MPDNNDSGEGGTEEPSEARARWGHWRVFKELFSESPMMTVGIPAFIVVMVLAYWQSAPWWFFAAVSVLWYGAMKVEEQYWESSFHTNP